MTTINQQFPAQQFQIGQVVKIDPKVHDPAEGTIVGVEWGPANIRLAVRSSSWIYHVRFAAFKESWQVSEVELLKWQK